MHRRTFLEAALSALPAAAAEARPNILILTTDQHFAESLSCRMGSRYLRTPNIDSLAARGLSYTRAYCANPLCVPSRTSLYSGHYPVETGVQTNDRAKVDVSRFPNMGMVFQKAGYHTAYFGKWHIPIPEKETARHGWMVMNPKKPDSDATIAESAAAYLRQKHTAPFLLVASLVNPHNICQWARDEELPEGDVGKPPALSECPPLRANSAPQRGEPDTVALMRRSYQATPMFPVSQFGEKQWREYIWAYYRMIEKVDAELGKVLAALRETGLEKDTLVVFTADHGDCQGAHGWNQKTILWEEAARVPYIFAGKGIQHGESAKLTQTGVHLLPTLCKHAGIAPPPGLPDPVDYVVVSNKMVQGAEIDGRMPTPDGRMIRTERYKYTVYSEGNRRESLVDLQNDPGEMQNLLDDPKHHPALMEHRKLLAAWGARYRDNFPYVTG